ncbi:MAG: hypothetical protein ABIR83_12975 [Nakamurella sp.]
MPPPVPYVRRPPRAAVAVLVTVLWTTGCASTSSPGRSMTTSTPATASSSAAASSGPGVQESFETGVPDAVISFAGGQPAGADRSSARRDEVRRDDEGNLLVITWGSTTCPRMPVNVTAVDLTTIDIVTGTVRVDPGSNAGSASETSLCLNDLGPTGSTVRLPDGAAGTGPLTVIVDGVAHVVA